jgi:UDP-N-acetylglucosamine 2-epimerase (non-hydrolysing)
MIVAVIGTRPEVIKMAPVVAALKRHRVPVRIVATGQHHDWRMMGSFLDSYKLQVDHTLTLRSRDPLGSFVDCVAGLGEVFRARLPQLVLAVGDTTSVVAAAFAARKCGSAFGHVESGLRAFSRELPEGEHRICSDALADLLFAPTRIAVDNLTREHVNGKVLLTGNPILDALLICCPHLQPSHLKAARNERKSGILVTVHRQETVDDRDRLANVISALQSLAESHEVEWPLHPRTRAKLDEFGLQPSGRLHLSAPLPHKSFLERLASAKVVITDSGGVQEEAAILGTPCVTASQHTERMETIEAGVGVLAGTVAADILQATREVLADYTNYARPAPYLYGDGHAGEKIAQACLAFLGQGDAFAEEPPQRLPMLAT